MPELPVPIPVPEPPLTDGVIQLRRWTQEDVPAIKAMCEEELAIRFTTVPSPYTLKDARDWVSGHAVQLARGENITFAIVAPPGDVPVGNIGLSIHSPGVGELGYMTAAAARGRGLMTRALNLVSEWAFTELGLERLQLMTLVENAGSQRVAAKCGFAREGVLRMYGVQRGERKDHVIFSRLPTDPKVG
jgi:RimJ/RimL family protein N-acetyltransferase